MKRSASAPQRPVQLGLAARGRRGGYRANAGRRRGRPTGRSDHYVPHVPRERVSRHEVVHVTLHCVAGLPSLRRPTAAGLVERIFAEEGARKGLRLVHYAIRSNHLHLVCEADDTRALSRGVQRVACRIARRLNVRFARGGRFFADRFHSHVLRTPRELRNALRYVLLNEHKDQARRGRIVKGVDPYSSHKWFDGWADRPVAPPPPARGDPVAAPASWLMRVGWRRHGLIGTNEMAPRASPTARSKCR